MILIILATAATYAAAAWLGVLLAEALYADHVPFEDGPASIKVPQWSFAAAGGLLGAVTAWHGASTAQLVTLGFVTVALVACTATDFACGLVPDVFTLLPLGALLVWFGLHGNFSPAFSALVVAVPFAAVAAFTRGLGMGWGDVKLAALGGAVLGASGAVLAFVIACAAVFVASRVLGERTRPIAFAPYIVGGIGAVLMIGSAI
jgi:prepilin signal peptidase PulO-like enzyme (type II secretory pathway)